MKKRIFALLLCLVMLASMIPLMGASAAENGGAGVVGVSPAAAAVSEDSKAVITAAGGDGAYQWQIYAGNDVWANIAGQTGAQLTVSYGMVCGLMDGGKAYVRCRVTNGENEAYSSPVEIVITGNEEENSGGIALFARRAARPDAADEPVGTVVREAYVLGEPVITLPGAATPAPTATPAAEATPAPAEDTDETPAEEPAPAPDAEAPAEGGEEATPSPAPAEEAAASPAPVTEAAEENTAAPAQDAEAAPTAARSISAPALRLAPLRRFSSVDTDEPAETGGASDATPTPAPDTYHIRINYVFEDGTQAANPWTAKLAAGSSYSATVVSPAIVGYAPDQDSVNVEVTNIDGDVKYTVTYKPSEVNYTVRHYVQNTMDDGYTLMHTDMGKAFTNVLVSTLGNLSREYEGCYSLLYDNTVRIAADGSTVIDIKYDRYYYLLNFDLDGGYGVEPIYARYGAPVSVGTPAKAGYIFAGWDRELPKTVPAHNDKFTAKWIEDKAGFTVVFWYENADPEADGTYKYSVAGTYEPADVAPGTEVSSGDYRNQNFTGRDTAHFTYNADKAETVTVAGDGSTVLNVYYTRNSYTLTFPRVQITCGQAAHTHSHEECCTKSDGHWWGCNTSKCPNGGKEHTHSNSCYSNASYTVTAKYDSDITYVWKNDPIKALLDQGYVFKSSKTDKYYSFLEKMPGQDITMTKTLWSGDTYTWYYYLEVLPGQVTTGLTTRTDGGKTYYLYNTTTIKGSGISLTYDEDYFPITGFTQRDNAVPAFDRNNKAYLYYTRNSYPLTFMNYGTAVKTGTKLYQADISDEYFVPEYPATLEPGAYTFDGWYIDETMQQRFSFENATMPAKPLVLHANWVPVTHMVTTWLTVDKDTPVNVGDTGSNVQTVPHGGMAEAPAEPVRDPYKFIGWFYVDENGTEKAFDFSMPVHRDLDLYAKWNGDSLVDYVIRYTDEAGNEIAPPTTGKALAGTTKTFDAKAGDELNEGYRTGYYPKTNSHSMVMEIKEENGKNEYTFVYKQMPEVQYTVRYINRATGNNVFDGVGIVPDKTGMTSAAVWTETFLTIKGYRPDAYQKRLVLSANPADNIITFYYEKDDVHAPVQVIHWTQNIAGDGYTEYQSSTDLNGEIGKSYSAEPISIAGFTFAHGAVGSTETALAEGKLTANVTEEGLVLNLYYDRIEYPYEFRFLEQGTDKVLANPEKGNARYQARVTQTAKDIPGYTLASDENQYIDIAIEDPADNAEKNVRIFYYTENEIEIKYVAVEADMGTVTPASETVKAITGTASGSTPKAKDGYKFVGWYTDEACTIPVDEEWVDADNKLVPGKTENYGTDEKPIMGYEAATYYAKFEDDVAQLTIRKQGADPVDENQSFVFNVTGPNGYSERVVICGNGSVTIKNLKPGTYTVTEEGWSWRYTGNGTASAEISALVPGSVTFTNVRQTEGSHLTNGWKWLGGDAYVNNPFN
ncbi:MAG: InlB B-repeat-containing protein [Eubacteriales bacterium]|nr:InlB B-repeat-containing protein [Eubacteriales bacterium]